MFSPGPAVALDILASVMIQTCQGYFGPSGSAVPCRYSSGPVVQATPGTDGSTNFMGTTTLHLLTSGDESSNVDIRR